MIRFGHIILLLWIGLTLLTIDSASAPGAWAEWLPDYCRRVNCYCEPIRLNRLVAQPLATYSNLGLILAGAFVLRAAFRQPISGSSPMCTTRAYPLAYGLSLAATGMFSFFYHASLTKAGDYLDLMGMYLFTSFILLYNIGRLRPMGGRTFALAYLALNAAIALGLVGAYDLQQVYFAGLALAAISTEVWVQRAGRLQAQWRFLGAALVCFGLGAAIWSLDSRGVLPCVPSAPLTWHAAWHLSVAVTAMLLFLYYRSETKT